ncbi:fungal specific transcription factor domain-containing protein [Geosmithia morbida]|uniref:Fungal specific transcription factor domain-containing protein n=1 Tax=Geosmithia morbida TaxID=1094350 RepID=A0A9P4Z1H5_9HYPO|nr:fungal specific transcription factor domain-containing protein [Geosmithia morbida]KAF4126968.1 fungal specific transcription factor domain-containing protein [Geosmithia morbida]
MFPTFAQHPKPAAPTIQDTTAPEAPVRPTRKQVSRACDWCRARRIKCDNGRPCRACRQRDAQCTHKGTDEPRTLPQALREIDKLKAHVKALEGELSSRAPASIPTPSETSIGASPISARTDGRPVAAQGNGSYTSSPAHQPPSLIPGGGLSPLPTYRPQWEGVYVATSRDDNQKSYYGPSSHFYFVARIGSYLDKSFNTSLGTRSLQPRGEARRNVAFVDPREAAEQTGGGGDGGVGVGVGARPKGMSPTLGDISRKPFMSRRQEEYFLGLLWESFHCLLPILDETDFRRHYASLWEPPTRQHRKNSALVDMALAVCLQFGYTFITKPSASSSSPPNNAARVPEDPTMAGRNYFHRAKSLLSGELESPTISTVQAHILSLMYLCCASFHNMSHGSMAQTVRMAQVLGLHVEPPASMPLAERELRKRIWWCLWFNEAKTAAKHGRLPAIDRSQLGVSPPSDSVEAATANGATLGSYGDVTWLSYAVHMGKLITTAYDIHSSLYTKFGEVLQASGLSSPYKDPRVLETCAEVVAAQLPSLKAWVGQVPSGLKMPHRGGGEPLSTDRAMLDMDPLAPTWLQRQRICLEIMYHTQVLYLCRPFITFYSNAGTYTPVAERLASLCVDHAIAQILVMHQTKTETDNMGGWTEYFFWHWNAMLTAAGFILAYPIHRSTPAARNALEKGTVVLDLYGQDFPVAAESANIIRRLISHADMLASRLRGDIPPASAVPSDINHNARYDELAWLDPSQQDDPVYYSEFMDLALSVDQFNSFERFFDVGDMSMQI